MGISDKNTMPKVLVLGDCCNIIASITEPLREHAVILTKNDESDPIKFIKESNIDLILIGNSISEELQAVNVIKDIKNISEIAEIPIIHIVTNCHKENIIHSLIVGADDYIIDIEDADIINQKIKSRLELLNKKILIAEDDEIVSDLLYNKFHNLGFKVNISSDGFEALDFLKNNSADLILLDRMMPGIDGIRLLTMLKEWPETTDIPVVLMTSNRYDEDILTGFKNGAADCIIRPFNLDEVLARCTRLIQNNIM